MHHTTMTSIRNALLPALIWIWLAGVAQAQYPWSAVHTVTGTTATAVSIAGKSTSAYTIHPSSLIVCASQAGTFTLELGGSAPTTTLSSTYPWYTKTGIANIFPLYSSWPLSFYTASNASGGVVISKIVLAGAGCAPFSGGSFDKKYWTLEIPKNTTSFYTVRAALDSSGNVTFSLNGEVVK